MRISRVIPPAVLFLLACSADRSDFQDEDRSKIAGQSGVVDIRADNNRDGVVSFDDDADDEEETVWNAQHGAVFIANIDDDQERCSVTVPNPTPGQPDVVANDVDLPKCNDAADEVVNGPDDELDLARIKTKPWPGATAGATGTITWTAASNVRLFKVKGGSFEVIQSGHELTTAELKTGVELAIEGKDIVRDPAKWDGYVDVTFQITAGAETGSDDVRLRVAPLITYSHVDDAEQTYVSAFNEAGNIAMRQDLLKATTAAGVPAPIGLPFTDRWAQDFFETGYMSIPGPGGTQHAMRVNIRSANIHNPADAPTRCASPASPPSSSAARTRPPSRSTTSAASASRIRPTR